jgi:hypothetical protein
MMGAEFLETAGVEKMDRAGTELAMVTLATVFTVIIWYIKGQCIGSYFSWSAGFGSSSRLLYLPQ